MSKKRQKRVNGNGEATLEKRNGVWYVRYFDEVTGKRPRVSTGESNRDKAEVFRRNFMSERKLEKSLDDKKTQLFHVKARLESEISSDEAELMTLKQIPVGELWTRIFESEEFESIRPKVKNQCQIIYKRFTKNFTNWVEANHKDRIRFLGDMTEEQANEFLHFIETTKSINERNKNMVWMRQVYNLFMDKKLVIKNPFGKCKKIKGHKATKKEIFSDDQIKAIKNVLEGKDIQLRSVFMVGIETGQRLGDCCCMKWSYFKEIDTVQGKKLFLVFEPEKTKNKSHNVVNCPVSDDLKKVLEDMKKEGLKSEEGYIFPDWAAKYLKCPSSVDNQVLRVIEEAGINRVNEEGKTIFGFHSFRHGMAARCINAGIPLTTTMSIIGHKKADMTLHYAQHENLNESLKVLDVLNAQMGEEGCLDEGSCREDGFGKGWSGLFGLHHEAHGRERKAPAPHEGTRNT